MPTTEILKTTSRRRVREHSGGARRPTAAERDLRRGLDGRVHAPGEAGYDALRRPLNPALEPRPALVVEAAGADDVRLAVAAAGEHGLPFAVQATGHGTHWAADGALLVRTGAMSRVLVDPDRRIARVGPGARWGEVLAAAAPFGLAPLSGSSPDVGVTGFTLGGGVGWLSRLHGFAADSVLRAEVVTASGRTVIASPDRNPDLFWAIRGGGGGFGVVTALEFRLHPVARVYGGISYFGAERAGETLATYAEWAGQVPDALSTALVLTTLPDTPETPEPVRGRRVLAVKALYAGERAEAERLLEPLRAAAGPALHDGYRTMAYADAAMGGTPPRHLDLVEDVPDPLVDILVDTFESAESPVQTIEIRHWGGAMAKPGRDAGPAGHRQVPFSLIADAADPALAEAVWPYATGGTFLNFLSDRRRTVAAFTATDHARLAAVKASYDPHDLFSYGHRIAPGR